MTVVRFPSGTTIANVCSDTYPNPSTSLPFFFVPGRISSRNVSACGPGLQARSATVSLSSVTGPAPESQIVPPSRRTSAWRMT